MNKVTVYFDMLGTLIKEGIVGNVKSCLIVTMKAGKWHRITKKFRKIAYPYDFTCSTSHSTILCLS